MAAMLASGDKTMTSKWLWISMLLLIIITISSNMAHGQINSSRTKYGIGFDVHSNIHSADFRKIPDCPSCSPGYKDGSGVGFGLAATIDVPIWEQWWLSGKLFFSTLNAELLRSEPIKVMKTIILPDGKKEYERVPGEFEHSIDTKFSIIGIEPAVKYNLFDNFFVNAGLSGALIVTKTYSQVERITKPNFGTFLDENDNNTYLRERNKFSGKLESANSLYLGANISISYQLPISKNNDWCLEPELTYRLGLTDLVSDELIKKWKANAIGVGIALKFAPKSIDEKYERIENIDTIRIIVDNLKKDEFAIGIEKSETKVSENNNVRLTQEIINRTDTLKIAKLVIENKFETINKIDTLTITKSGLEKSIIVAGFAKTDTKTLRQGNTIITQKIIQRTDTLFTPKSYRLGGEISIYGVDKQGNEYNSSEFSIEEFSSNRLAPLLNYIFFDENSAELPARYIKITMNEASKFNIKSVFNESNMGISYHILNIVGKRMQEQPDANLEIVGCNSNVNNEKNNLALSQKRAETVRNYLNSVWGIEKIRLVVSKRNLPEKYSRPEQEKMKREENQRVELYSDKSEILEPIFIQTIDRTAQPAILRVKPNVFAESGVKRWKLKGYQLSDTLHPFIANGIGALPGNIDWDLAKVQKNTPKYAEPIICELQLEDAKGQVKTIKNETESVEVISLKNKIDKKSTNIEIEVFSLILFDFDKAEVEAKNQKIIELVHQRIKPQSSIEIVGYSDITGTAKLNAKLSEERAKAVKSELKIPKSSTRVGKELLFDNDLPEGRFFCRTVEIIVKTPTK